MEDINNKCLFDKGSKCIILKIRECKKCKFFKEDTEENRNKYIKQVDEDIKNYAKQHI